MAQAFIIRKGGSSGEYSGPPEFTYTGQYEFIDDGDGNWRLKFLTSGTFVLLRPSELQIDVFLVGGGGGGAGAHNAQGGGGGGGGYTATHNLITIEKGVEYPIVVGLGGAAGTSNLNKNSGTPGRDGGVSSAFGFSANGGKGGLMGRVVSDMSRGGKGGDGGSGGGAGCIDNSRYMPGNGGSDGKNGGGSTPVGGYSDVGGTGQGTTTREFGDTDGDLYSGGGGGGGIWSSGNSTGGDGGGGAGGGSKVDGQPGTPNTGGGGGGANTEAYLDGRYPGVGGSGIVIIRNTRAGINTEAA